MLIKIKNTIFRILYVLIIIYLLVFLPTIWGHRPLVVISGSMNPTLQVGSILYYQKDEINDFNVDDILVFKTENHIISHRIVEKTRDGFITKGDANKNSDFEIVNNSQVLGKGNNWCIPYLGFYADFIYTHKYLLFISITILLIDLCNDFYKNHKKRGRVRCEKC